MKKFTTIAEIEEYFATISYKKKDFPPFHMITKALELLGNPEKDLKYIHITGTNGKGSTSHYLSMFLSLHNVKTGLFTSPHIHNITERLKVNNQSIPEADFIEIFNRIFPIISPTCQLIQFEWLTVMAFVYFKDVKVDVVVLEVGIGGLFDSTNIIPSKLAAVITNVDFDHQNMLGSTLVDITKQKAGIITSSTDFIFTGKIAHPIVMKTIQQTADSLGKTYFLYGSDYCYDVQHSTLHVYGKRFVIKANLPIYQYENVTLALAVAEKILTHTFKRPVSQEKIEDVISNMQLPIRFEQIRYKTKTLILDGAHNLPGVSKLIESLQAAFPMASYSFVFCAMGDKAYQEMIEKLETIGTVTLYDYHQIYQRALEIEEHRTEEVLTSIEQLETYMADSKTDVIVFVGSIYFVSYIRGFLVEH